jgi:hypothetical protein
MRAIAFAAVLASFSCLAEGAPPPTDAEVIVGVARQARSAFLTQQYDLLERQAENYRATKPRTHSGLWLLTTFDDVLEAMFYELDANNPAYVEEGVNEWLKAYPKSPTARLAFVRLQLAKAWNIRGRGYADTVPEQAWKQFHELVHQAENYLLKNKDIAAVDPNWYVMMFEVATAADWERPRFDKLLDEAYAAAPEFYNVHFAAATYLLPKWHGDAAELEKFANRSVEATRAIEGESLYARIYWYAAQSQYCEFNLVARSRVSWEHMKAGFEDVMKRYPDQWNLNNYTLFACEAGDWKKVRELMPKIDKPDMRAWKDPQVFRACQDGKPIHEMLKKCGAKR